MDEEELEYVRGSFFLNLDKYLPEATFIEKWGAWKLGGELEGFFVYPERPFTASRQDNTREMDLLEVIGKRQGLSRESVWHQICEIAIEGMPRFSRFTDYVFHGTWRR